MTASPYPIRPSSRRAFTLIELLACIAVIGVLASILIAGIGKVLESARKAQLVSNLHTTHGALMTYAAEHNNLLPGASGNANTGGDDSWQYALAAYVNEIPGPDRTWMSAELVEDSVMRDPLDTSLKSVGTVRHIRNIAINGLARFGERPMGASNRNLNTIDEPARLMALTTGMPASNGDEYSNGMRVRDQLYQNEIQRKKLTRMPGVYYCIFIDGHLEIVQEADILAEAQLSSRSYFFDTAATNAKGWNP